MKFSNIFTITKKDLRSQFDHPTAYIVLGVFLLLWEFIFFRSAFLVGEASLRILFDFLPWLLIFVVPAITMGSISQEKNDGTLELLLTHPLKEQELLIGKFIAAVSFFALAFTVVFPIALSLNVFGNVDWGVIFGQYIGALLFASVLSALGIFISSLVVSPVSSLLITAALSFIFVILGFEFVTASLPPLLATLAERLSVLSHFESMARGIIDIRDLWYFLSAIVIFLSLAYLQLLKFKFGDRKTGYRSYQAGISLFIGIAILTNIIGNSIPGRIDLTEDGLYTLTSETKDILSSLTDVVNITIYASGNLPAQLQPVLRDIRDVMHDYKTYGKGNILVTEKNPIGDPLIAQEASSIGIREVQFNVVGEGEFKVQTGFLGLATSYANNNEIIPFLQNTNDLEYQLTSFIKQLTRTDKKTILFLSGHGEKNVYSDYRILYNELEKQFTVNNIEFDDTTKTVPPGTDTIVIAGPSEPIDDETRSKLRAYIDQGGSVFFMIDAMSVNPKILNASVNQNSLADFLYDYGVSVNQDVVYDLRSNETVRFGNGIFSSFLLPYPFWAQVPSTKASPIVTDIENIIFPWGSSVSLNETKLQENGFTAINLFLTSRFGGKSEGTVFLSPEEKLPQDNLGEQTIAISLEGNAIQMNQASQEVPQKSRIIVVGDSDFLTDQFVSDSPQNIAFGISAISWLSNEKSSLVSIQVKNSANRKLLFRSSTDIFLVQYGNMALLILLLLAFGFFRLMRRRNLRHFAYSPSSL